MTELEQSPPEFVRALQARFGANARLEDLVPPVFTEMSGRILAYDPDTRTLTASFPAERRYHNPYRVMQGGMLAAAIDNAIGPLSVLVAPPNLTREMTIKYKKAVSEEYDQVIVKAWVVELLPPYLHLAARAESAEGVLFARASARHFILPR